MNQQNLSQDQLMRNASSNRALEVSRSSISSYEYEEGEDDEIIKVKKAKSTEIQATFNLFKSFIGTGILALPRSYSYAGLGLALIAMITCGLLSYHTMKLIIDAADQKPRKEKVSLESLAEEYLGNWGKYSIQFSIFVMQVSICIGALIFANNFLDHTFCTFGVMDLCGNKLFNVIFCAILVLPFTFIDNTHYFYIPSLVASIFLMLGIGAQMDYNIEILTTQENFIGSFLEKIVEFEFGQISLFFGVASYAFEGIGVLFTIRQSMAKPQRLPTVIYWNFVILVLIYTLFPSLSYMAFGKKVPEIILLSLPPRPFYTLVQTLYAVAAILSFPLQLSTGIKVVEQIPQFRDRIFDYRGMVINGWLRYSVRFGIQFFIFFIAFTARSFHLFLNLVGSCVFTYATFVLPVLVYQKAFQGKIPLMKTIINYGGMILGITLGTMGLIESLTIMLSY
jgi:Amino acid permeases